MENKKKRKPGKVLWRILFFLLALILFVGLELGKHTILGWVWVALVLALFYWFRVTKIKKYGRLVRVLSWIGLLGVCAVALWASFPPEEPVPAVVGENPQKTGVVHLEQGDLTGVMTEDGQVEVYAGIPYAKPPVDELRWKEPQPADGWEGVLEADHFAPASMQTTNLPIVDSVIQIVAYHDYEISLHDNYRVPVSEDSLYVNIWKPAGQDLKDLPVLVYIHGGSLQTGEPWYQDYSGEGLAREGVIVVNMGYRLGIFGFFADPELAEESPNHTTGNYGLLDQIMALQWVQDNIAAFGGNPDNVTLAGESAGSACVTALCTSPRAKGLFRRAIAESSTVTSPKPVHSFRLLDEAFEAAEETKQKYQAGSAEDLRELPAKTIVGELSVHHHITVDGYVLTETPYESYKKGIHNEEAQLQGFNKEEGAPFIYFSQANLSNYEEKVRNAFDEPYASEVLALYPASADDEAKRNWADLNTAVLFTYGHYCWARQAAVNNIPCYMYYFTKGNGRLGSWHSGEEVYLYGNIPPSSKLYTEEDRALSEVFRNYVKNYVTSGDPNGAELTAWNSQTKQTNGKVVLELGDSVQEIEAPYLELYEILDRMYGYQQ